MKSAAMVSRLERMACMSGVRRWRGSRITGARRLEPIEGICFCSGREAVMCLGQANDCMTSH